MSLCSHSYTLKQNCYKAKGPQKNAGRWLNSKITEMFHRTLPGIQMTSWKNVLSRYILKTLSLLGAKVRPYRKKT
jgi:hypothetical protein